MEPIQVCHDYARQVRDGKILANKWHRLACERHLRDLKRWGEHADGRFAPHSRAKAGHGPWYFNQAKARHAVEFIQTCCRHVKTGLLTHRGERVRLEPWQIFVVCSLFGWADSRSHARRFRIFYLEVPRKNGKSFLLACIALYCFLTDGVEGAECYSAARTYTQASLVWKAAKQMLPLSRVLNRRVGPHRSLALSLADGSIFRPVHSDALSQEGLDPNFACMDELHTHRTPEMWNVFADAMGARPQPLMGSITTAGSNVDGVCFEQRMYVQRILDGWRDDEQFFADERYFGIVFGADEEDDWQDPATWRKANPNLGVSIAIDTIEHDARLARSSAQKLADFKTKRLCLWVGAGTPFFDMAKFDTGADPALTLDAMEGKPCWMAVDLAARFDIAGFNLQFDLGGGHVADFHRLYLPKGLIDTGGRMSQFQANMLDWERRKELTLTEGDTLDFTRLEDDLRAAAKRFNPHWMAFDPWSPQTMQRMSDEGFPAIAVPQNAKQLSPPMKELLALMLDGKYHHPGNHLVRWSYANVHANEDHNENVFPRKERRGSPQKIDAAVMSIMARSLAMTTQAEPEPSVLEY